MNQYIKELNTKLIYDVNQKVCIIFVKFVGWLMDSNHYFLLIVNWTAIQTRPSLLGRVRFEQISLWPISSSSNSIAVEYFVLNHHKN